MKTAFLVFEILAILSQMFHNYWLIVYASELSEDFQIGKLKINPKKLQAWVFCGIIDVSIIFAILEEYMLWAYGGIIVLCIINVLYVFNSYSDLAGNKRYSENRTVRRRYVVAYFNAILIPACILVFATLYSLES